MWTLALLLACKEPSVTGPTALVGRVIDPGGFPARELHVQSVEASDVTDENGAFVVRIKDPNRYVEFAWEGARYRRLYDPSDDGTVVEIRLPALHDVDLTCDLDTACDVRATWKVGDRLTASKTATCGVGKTLPWTDVPAGTPEITCKSDPQPVLFEDGRRLTLTPPPVPVRVRVLTEDGTTPDGCGVSIDGEVARGAGEGFWAGKAAGTAIIAATCHDRPAVPKTVRAAEGLTVTLEWSPSGPSIDLAPWLPSAEHLDLVLSGEGGWHLRVPRSPSGRFELPPLQRGTYYVYAGGVAPLPLDRPTAPGRLWVIPSAGPDGTGVVGLAGVLIVDRDMLDGAIRVESAGAG